MLRVDSKMALRSEKLHIARSAVRYPVAPAITTAFVAVTAGLAFRLSISQDESYSLHTASHGVLYALWQGIVYEAQAPLYFGVLAAWRSISDSLFYARLLSLAFSLITLGITWRFARRYIAGISPAAILAAVAFNPFTIWAAVEIRPYAAAVTLSFAMLYYFFRGWIDERVNWRARAAFVVSAIAGAYTQYYVATLVVAAAVGLVVSGKRSGLVSYFAAAAGIGVALAPILFMVPGQLSAYSTLEGLSPLPGYAIILALFEFLYPHHWMGSWIHPPLQNALYFCAAVAPALLCLIWLRKVNLNTRVLIATTVTLTVIFALFTGVAHVRVVFPRQTAVLFAPTLFSAFALFGSMRADRRRISLTTFSVIYMSLVCLSLWSDYRGLSKDGDWQRVGDYLRTHAARNDAVAVFDAEVELPVSYYYAALPITPIPRPLSFDRFDEGEFVIRTDDDLSASLGRATRDRRRVWLVRNGLCSIFPEFYGCSRLDAYVARNFTTVRVVRFNGSSISELRPRETGHRGSLTTLRGSIDAQRRDDRQRHRRIRGNDQGAGPALLSVFRFHLRARPV
jgi:hypothetical protein